MCYLLPKHGNFIFDARLLPLQCLFGNALDCNHLPRDLLPSHHHFRKRTTVGRERERELYISTEIIDTGDVCSVSRGHSVADTAEYTGSIL